MIMGALNNLLLDEPTVNSVNPIKSIKKQCSTSRNTILYISIDYSTAAVAEWVRAWDTLTIFELRCVGGREFDPRPGQYSRMSFSSDQVTGTVSLI